MCIKHLQIFSNVIYLFYIPSLPLLLPFPSPTSPFLPLQSIHSLYSLRKEQASCGPQQSMGIKLCEDQAPPPVFRLGKAIKYEK